MHYFAGVVVGWDFVAAGFGAAGFAAEGLVAPGFDGVVFGFAAAGFAFAGAAEVGLGFAVAGLAPTRATVTLSIRTGVNGRLSLGRAGTRAILSTTSCPSTTCPKIVWRPSR
jgi:hypothetical protein